LTKGRGRRTSGKRNGKDRETEIVLAGGKKKAAEGGGLHAWRKEKPLREKKDTSDAS